MENVLLSSFFFLLLLAAVVVVVAAIFVFILFVDCRRNYLCLAIELCQCESIEKSARLVKIKGTEIEHKETNSFVVNC